MLLTKDKIKNAVRCAREVLNQPEIYGDNEANLAISIDAVTDYIAAKFHKTITIREVNFDAVHLKGRKETYTDGNVFIDIRANLSDFWKRFVALKELLHIMVDGDADDHTPYGDVILEKLVLEGHIGVLSGNGDEPPAQSELVAEIAAIEVIYPIQKRAEDIKGVASSQTTLAKLEIKYEAPSPIVSTALNVEYLGFVQAALEAN
jgi:hypothetical protein